MLGDEGEFVPCLHSVGRPLAPGRAGRAPGRAIPTTSYIAHFPEERTIWSYGSGYGGNALLGKKCLRAAHRLGHGARRRLARRAHADPRRREPRGREDLRRGGLPERLRQDQLRHADPARRASKGWKVTTVGDDIAWIKPGRTGALRAINPEAGYFGVAPGHLLRIQSQRDGHRSSANTIFTNVALTDDGDVWWEGMTETPPAHLIDWQGQDWTPDCRATGGASQCALHRAARTSALRSIRPGTIRRACRSAPSSSAAGCASDVPLVFQAFNWSARRVPRRDDGLGDDGGGRGTGRPVRRDPMAMLPFCGYNMADYFSHWLRHGPQDLPTRRASST